MLTRRVCLSGRHSRDSSKTVNPILALFHNACKRYKTASRRSSFKQGSIQHNQLSLATCGLAFIDAALQAATIVGRLASGL